MSINSQKKPVIIIVAALLPSLGIGNKGTMPWRLSKEMRYFKSVTTTARLPNLQNAVIMGRKTWDSIPLKFRPLPGRLNIVLSRSHVNGVTLPEYNNVVLYNDIDAAIEKAELMEQIDKIFIIGGAEIYNTAIKNSRIEYILLSEITCDKEIEIDTFLHLPLYKENDKSWSKMSKKRLQEFVGEEVELPEKDIKEKGFSYNFTLWERA